jgi:hypothetical protein
MSPSERTGSLLSGELVPGFIASSASRVWLSELARHSGRLHATFPAVVLFDGVASAMAAYI